MPYVVLNKKVSILKISIFLNLNHIIQSSVDIFKFKSFEKIFMLGLKNSLSKKGLFEVFFLQFSKMNKSQVGSGL